MIDMFYECSSLKNLNLNNFDSKNVTNMIGMFYECSSLKNLKFISPNLLASLFMQTNLTVAISSGY